VLSVIVEEMRLPTFAACGLSVRKLRIHLQREGPRPRSRGFEVSLEGIMVLNGEL